MKPARPSIHCPLTHQHGAIKHNSIPHYVAGLVELRKSTSALRARQHYDHKASNCMRSPSGSQPQCKYAVFLGARARERPNAPKSHARKCWQSASLSVRHINLLRMQGWLSACRVWPTASQDSLALAKRSHNTTSVATIVAIIPMATPPITSTQPKTRVGKIYSSGTRHNVLPQASLVSKRPSHSHRDTDPTS